MQMVLMMQLVVQIGANAEHGANGANGAHGANGVNWCTMVHQFFKRTMHQITHWCKSLVLVCSTTCINMSNQ